MKENVALFSDQNLQKRLSFTRILLHRWQLCNPSYFTDYQCVESRIPQDLFRRRALLTDISIYIMQMNVF